MPVLSVRPALADFQEPKSLEEPGHLARLQDRNRSHLRNLDSLDSYEFRFELRLTVLKEHLDDFTKILTQLVNARALAMRSGPTRDVADIKSGIGISFDDDVEGPHAHHLPDNRYYRLSHSAAAT